MFNRKVKSFRLTVLILATCTSLLAGAAIQPPRRAPAMPANEQPPPIVKIAPLYPAVAAREGLEGWVIMTYSISPQGQVKDIIVLDASPADIFNKEAVRAVSKWRYTPSVKNGKPQEIQGLMMLLEFKLTH